MSKPPLSGGDDLLLCRGEFEESISLSMLIRNRSIQGSRFEVQGSEFEFACVEFAFRLRYPVPL